MSLLTSYLQAEFAKLSAPHWRCRPEMALISDELQEMLGYAPRADVLLERLDESCRLWIEFEVSRADPVANHAKYATAHLFSPQPQSDSFVSMVSPHVARGRRNLAANTIQLMRRIGMSAFQTVLFPHVSGHEIQRLNHLSRDLFDREQVDVEPELERVLAISQPILTAGSDCIHFAGDLSEVIVNVRRWNEEVEIEKEAELWGCRTVTYFVHDPKTSSFAPSKFCAYVPISVKSSPMIDQAGTGVMTIDTYARIDQKTKIFDGTRARTHLTARLGMFEFTAVDRPEVAARFDRWLAKHHDRVRISPAGPTFLLPPTWFV